VTLRCQDGGTVEIGAAVQLTIHATTSVGDIVARSL
jgi:hypothetical protein